jgi:DNA polymerase-4
MRKILHVDMDAFFASVEQRDNPEYQGRPVIVGGTPAQRGVVAACSYEAREFGIHSAMPSSRAVKRCPEAIFLPPRFSAYKACSEKIHAIFNDYTSLVEPLSLDEAYLDVSDCKQCDGSATKIAAEIKRRIQNELNLVASAGVSYNKFLAKIASDMDKPNGLCIIRPEHAQAFIDELPVGKFFGVGRVTEKKMHQLDIFYGADLKKYTLAELQQYFGKAATYYYNIVRGFDERPVRVNRERKSIGKETTFCQDLTDKRKIWATLKALAVNIVEMLNKRGLAARTIVLKVKYNDFKLITRSVTLPASFSDASSVTDALPVLLKKTSVGEVPVRLVGISLAGLSKVAESEISSQQSCDVTTKRYITKPSKKNTEISQLGLFR